jgi:hypothetical protein
VLWVEGHPDYYAVLCEKLAPYPGQRALGFVISDQDGQRVTFRCASNTGSTTMFAPTEAHRRAFAGIEYGSTLELVAERPDTYFAREGVDLRGISFLVLDLEGAELLALRGLGAILDQIEWVLVEVSFVPAFEGGPLFVDIDGFLHQRGFVRRRLWPGRVSGDALYQRADIGAVRAAAEHAQARLIQLAATTGLLSARGAALGWARRRLLG